MRKYISLIGITLTLNVSSATFIEGQQFIKLNKQISCKSQVIEFFSFYCLHCYQFEQVYHISNKVKKLLPNETNITKYHVDSMGPLGKQLTQAWAVTIVLGIEDKVSPLLFEGLQKTKTIKTLNDIRTVFIKAGINAEEYDAAWNSFTVRSLVMLQEKMATELQLCGVPAIFVNGKYMIKNDGLDMSSIDAYTQQLAEVVEFLLGQD